MAAFFPSSVATALQLLTAVNNTKVLLDVDAGIGDTTITVDDTSPLPASGYVTFNDNETTPETIYYTGKTGTDLTGVTRGADGTAAATHIADGEVALEVRENAAYHNLLSTEMIGVEQYLSDRFGITSNIVVPSGKTVTLAATSNQMILGATRTVTISAPTPASSSRTWTIPDITADGTFASLTGTQTFTGSKTFTSAILGPDGLVGTPGFTFASDLDCGMYRIGTNNIGLSVNGAKVLDVATTGLSVVGTLTPSGQTLGANGTVSLPGLAFASDPDCGLYWIATNNIGLAVNATKMIDLKTTGVGIKGTTTNDNPEAGQVGEIIESKAEADANVPSTNTWGDLTSISVTAGDWLITGACRFSGEAAAWTGVRVGMSSTSGNDATGMAEANNQFLMNWASSTTTPSNFSVMVPNWHLQLASTTTIYLKRLSQYSSGQPITRAYRITAVRIR